MSDADSVESDDMTVEDQNRKNSETDDIHSILGTFVQAEEETLEDLVGGLMYLTMEDIRNSSHSVLASAPKQSGFATPGSAGQAMGDNRDVTIPIKKTGVAGRGACSLQSDSGTTPSTVADIVDTDGIEEEVLVESADSRRTSEEVMFRQRPVSLTKFDNFVDAAADSSSDVDDNDAEKEEEENEEDFLPTSGYMASFASGNSASPESQDTTPHSPVHQTEESDPQQLPSPSCESQPSQPSPQSNQHTPHISNAPDTNTVTSERRTNPHPQESEADCDKSAQVCDEDVEGPAWMLNPGEVEEEAAETTVTQTVSMMDYVVKVAAVSSDVQVKGGHSQEQEEICSDEVVPFELDGDFDYDSVVYTPKFSQSEMAYLKSFLPDTS